MTITIQQGKIYRLGDELLLCTIARESGVNTFKVVDADNNPVEVFSEKYPGLKLDNGTRIISLRTNELQLIA